jgi:Ca2+-transporting ATPase
VAAVRACRSAGITVVMITGDHPASARAIAGELGIAVPGAFDEVLTGAELEALAPGELRRRSARTAVYARVSPAHKLLIVRALQENGHVVAMTGDGVNDAPALKQAQIGVAMGRAGTEVARQAASMILTDDDFSSIVAAVEEGRAIYGNIKRTIQYLLSTNLAELLIVLGASVLGLPVPFTPLNLLWINLVTDGFPSLALAAEPLDARILRESTRPSPRSFFDRPFLTELFLIGLLMTLLVLATYARVLAVDPAPVARTYAFTLLVYMTLLRSFSCRSETRSYFELPVNYYHLGSVLIPIALQLALADIASFREVFRLVPLTLREHAVLVLGGAVPVTVVELLKLWRRK